MLRRSMLWFWPLALVLMGGCGGSPSSPDRAVPPGRTNYSGTQSPGTQSTARKRDYSSMSSQVLLGNETIGVRNYDVLAGKRVGLLTNPSGVNRRGTLTVDLFRAATNVNLVALFAAEHGIYGEIRAGGEFPDHIDRRTGLKVFSLYAPGPIRAPTPEMLSQIDVLVYDIQDTGCRSYTYIATMGAAMQACAKAGKEFMVLDRPNPLGGLRVEGSLPDPQFLQLGSLVVRWNIPYVYGMTCGELARMINGEGWISGRCNLKVMPMTGWRRDMVWEDTGIPWKPTSPNVPYAHSPLHYVSTGILGELGGVNIGIRFGRPFEVTTAPWLNAQQLSARMNGFGLPGVDFRPFRITYNNFAHQGVEIVFTDPARAPLTPINFYLLEGIRQETGRDLFAEAQKRGASFAMFDKVNGTTDIRKDLQRGASAASIVRNWERDESAFRAARQKYLIY